MTRVHVPVLAGELIDLHRPRAGRDRGRLHLRRGRPRAPGRRPARARPGTLVCIDRDPAAEERFDELAAEVACETRFLRMDYAEGLELLGEEGLEADLVYLDLGISSMQVDARERGFSYSYDAPLDMRMDPSQELDARAVVNEWDERRLAQIFRRYGEERYARRIAREIVRRRERAPLETTGELVEAIEAALPAAVRRSFGGGHPAKRVFQAIRIAVNDELDSLDRALPLAWDLLRPGRPAGGDLLPLARGPAREALPRRPRARLHLPARLPRLRLRARAGGRAAHAAAPSRPRRARSPQNPRAQVGPPARRPPHRAGGGGLMAARRRRRRRAAPAAGPARAGAPRPPGPPARSARRRPAQRRVPQARAALARRDAAARAPLGARMLDALLSGRVWIGARRRAARRDRLLQRRPAADEPRDHAHGRPRRRSSSARTRGLRQDVAGLGQQRAHPGGGRPARPRAARRRRGPLPEVEPDASTRRTASQAHHRAGRRRVAPDPIVAAGADDRTDHADRRRRTTTTPPPTTPRRRPPRTAASPDGLAGAAGRAQDRAAVRPLPGAARLRRPLRATWIGTVKAGSLGARAVQQQVEDIGRARAARHDHRPPRHRAGRLRGRGHRLRQPVPDQRPRARVGAAGAAARASPRTSCSRSSSDRKRPSSTCATRWTRRAATDRAAQDRGHRHGHRAEAQLSAGLAGVAGARARSAPTTTACRASSTRSEDTLGGHDGQPPGRQGRARRAGQPGRDRARASRATTCG